MHQQATVVLECDLGLVLADLGHEPDTKFRMRDDVPLVIVVADRVGPRPIVGLVRTDLVDELLPRQLFRGGALARSGRLGRFLFYFATWLAVRVDVAAHRALHPPDLFLVLGDDRVRGVLLALWAVGLDVGADLVDVVLENEVHTCPRNGG